MLNRFLDWISDKIIGEDLLDQQRQVIAKMSEELAYRRFLYRVLYMPAGKKEDVK